MVSEPLNYAKLCCQKTSIGKTSRCCVQENYWHYPEPGLELSLVRNISEVDGKAHYVRTEELYITTNMIFLLSFDWQQWRVQTATQGWWEGQVTPY